MGDIAAAVKVPKEYLRKIFQQLTRKRLVVARRGARGGYRLARPPAELALKDVVEAVEGELPVYSCLRLNRHCGLATRCPIKKAFAEAGEKMAGVLQAVSLADISRELTANRREHPWLKVTA